MNIHQQNSPGKFKIDMMHHALLWYLLLMQTLRKFQKASAVFDIISDKIWYG